MYSWHFDMDIPAYMPLQTVDILITFVLLHDDAYDFIYVLLQQ